MKISHKRIGTNLEKLQAAIRKTEQAKARLTKAQTKAVAFDKTVLEEIPRLEEDLREAGNELAVVADEASRIACGLLQPILDNRLRTLTAVLRIFSNSLASACRVAMETDCWKSGQNGMALLSRPRVFNGNTPGLLRAARRLEVVLAEGLRKDGNFLQFLAAVSAPDEQPPASPDVKQASAEAAVPSSGASQEPQVVR